MRCTRRGDHEAVAHGFGIPLDLDGSFDRLVRAFVAGLRKGGSWIPSRCRLGALCQGRREDQARHLLRLVQLREVPRGGTEPARVLLSFSPAGMDRFFKEAAEGRRPLQAALADLEVREKLAAFTDKYGYEFAELSPER
jgi:hypothetical protein